MNCELRRDPIRTMTDVYIWENDQHGYRVLVHEDRQLVWKTLQDGELIDREEYALLSLPMDALDAIVAEARGTARVPDLAVEALQDARAVRDRLLAVVERVVPS